MMKIGVLSDTHAGSLEDISPRILQSLTSVDMIIHAGDFTFRAVLDGLRGIAPVRAVCGNMDSGELKAILPSRDEFTISGKKIGLVHGSGGPPGIEERVRGLFGDVDIIIFGHSHVPSNQHVRGSLLFNPGQARYSFGLLTVDKDIAAEVIQA